MNAQNQQATSTAQAHEVIDLESMADEAQRAWQVAAAAGRDSRALSADHRAAALNALCRALRLNPLTNPIIYVTLNGKEVLYVTRQATDQISARLELKRETIEGPEVRDFAGTKLLYCKVRVTFPGPNGRSETSTATLPATDLVNAIMKVETKAKRRATLSIAGLGMLGEDDVEGIPVDSVFGNGATADSEPTAAQAKLSEDLSDCTVNRDVVAAWLKHRDALTADGDDVRKEAFDEVVKVLMRLMECPKTAAKKYLCAAIAERDEAIRAERDAAPPKVEPAAETTAATEAIGAPLDPPTLADFRAQLERCLSLNAVADLWRASRGELVEADRAPAWTASLDRVAVLTSAPSTQGIGALLKKRIAELDAPKPTPPDGGPSGTRTPAAPSSADAAPLPTAAANDPVASASAGPRVVLDADETEARYLRDDAIGAEAWAAHLTACAAIFAMAGSHTKRAEAFRAAGVLATRRAQTLDAIAAREGRGPEAAMQALDGYRTRRVVPIGQSVRARTAAEIRAAQTAAGVRGAA